jgi:hypothetical protein
MSAQEILDRIGEQHGWNDQFKILVLYEYIDNQCDEVGFEDFLLQQEFDNKYSTFGESNDI